MPKIQSLDRALDVLEALAGQPGGLNVTEIATRLRLPKSTAFRMVSALAQRGYAERRAEDGRYIVGMILVDLCHERLNDLELKIEARPFLSRLCQQAGSTVFLAVLQGDAAVYIDAYETFNSLRKFAIIGQRRPLYCSGLGKALLMGMSDDALSRAAHSVAFARHTATTIAGPAELLQDITASRRRGWALDDRELEPSIRCVAAPIRSVGGAAIAAISVSWDIFAKAGVDEEYVGSLVAEAARGLSRRMGWTDPGTTQEPVPARSIEPR